MASVFYLVFAILGVNLFGGVRPLPYPATCKQLTILPTQPSRRSSVVNAGSDSCPLVWLVQAFYRCTDPERTCVQTLGHGTVDDCPIS